MKKIKDLPSLLYVLLISLVLAWVVAGCSAGTPISPTREPQVPSTITITNEACPDLGMDVKNLSFETLVQGYRLSAAQSGPALYLALDPTSLDALISDVDPRDQGLVGVVNLDSHSVLAAFWGVRPSGGESITICAISITNNSLTVGVVLQENDPEVPKVDAATYPYHLVLVNRLDLPEGSLHYRLVSDSGLLAEGDIP